MSRRSVIAAIAALSEFTLDQLAAYSGEDLAAVHREVDRLQPAVLPVTGDDESGTDHSHDHARTDLWRVADPDAVRVRLREMSSDSSLDMGAFDCSPESGLTSDLLLAEELIVESSEETEPQSRALLAASASNHLRQFVATVFEDDRPWWLIRLESLNGEPADRLALESAGVNAARVRTDSALIRLTQEEAAGGVSSFELLFSAVHEVCRLPDGMDGDLQRGLFHRLVDLATTALSPTGLRGSREAAPDRLLRAVGCLRAKARAVDSVHLAAQAFSGLLDGLQRQAVTVDRPNPHRLFTTLGNLPDGRERLLVYTDLLPLIPQQYRWQAEASPIPDVLIQAIADHATSHHLQQCADVLETKLKRSPYQSPAALVGQVAHVLPELAARGGPLDATVYPRSEVTRRELLELVGAPL
jgi:hypothetical protein